MVVVIKCKIFANHLVDDEVGFRERCRSSSLDIKEIQEQCKPKIV